MKRFITTSILFLILFFVPAVHAGSLQIVSVGGVATSGSGTKYTIWESNPTIVGTTLPNTPVNIIVDGVLGSVTSDGRGSWNYTPGGLGIGNHQVSVAAGTDSVAFTIAVITPPTLAPSGAPPPPKRLPVTAGPTPVLGILVAAVSLLTLGFHLRRS